MGTDVVCDTKTLHEILMTITGYKLYATQDQKHHQDELKDNNEVSFFYV